MRRRWMGRGRAMGLRAGEGRAPPAPRRWRWEEARRRRAPFFHRGERRRVEGATKLPRRRGSSASRSTATVRRRGAGDRRDAGAAQRLGTSAPVERPRDEAAPASGEGTRRLRGRWRGAAGCGSSARGGSRGRSSSQSPGGRAGEFSPHPPRLSQSARAFLVRHLPHESSPQAAVGSAAGGAARRGGSEAARAPASDAATADGSVALNVSSTRLSSSSDQPGRG